MKKIYAILVWIFTATILMACNDEPKSQVQYVQPQQQQQSVQQQAPVPQPAPVVVQSAAPAASGHDGTDMLMAGAIGYLAGRGGVGGGGGSSVAPSTNSSTTTINKTIVNKTIVQQAPPPAPKPVTPAYTYKPAPSTPSRSFSSSSSFRSGRR